MHLPDGAEVVVDSKVPLSAYLDAIEASDDEMRTRELRDHANQVRTHVQKLASKEYWQPVRATRPTSSSASSPATRSCRRPSRRIRRSLSTPSPNKVLLTGPTALIALLQTVSYGWRQERLADNTEQIQHLAEQLYDRLGKFASHLAKLPALRSTGPSGRTTTP